MTHPEDVFDKEIPIGIGIVLFPVHMLVNGVILMLLWRWFVVPLGVMEIGVFHAFGIGLLVAWASMNRAGRKMTFERLVVDILYDCVVLGLAFIASFWV